jgi:protein KRI1
MSKRKANELSSIASATDSKKFKQDPGEQAKLTNTSNPLVDSDSESGSEDESEGGGALLEEHGFKINEDYAKRFEHNKKREELHRCKCSGPMRLGDTDIPASGGEILKRPKTFQRETVWR